MTAAVTLGHGGPGLMEVRSDWPRPQPGPGEVVLRVTAAALNNTDIWSREGAYGSAMDPDATAGWRGVPLDFPLVQGMDIAGEVDEVGPGVPATWVGRRVLVDPIAVYEGDHPSAITGSEFDGGFAEYHLCSHARVHDVSGSPLEDSQLSCLPVAYGTALGMLNRAGCSAGERVLVTGASGGVGMAAIQLLVDRGCEVVARTSVEHSELVQSFGASELSLRGGDDVSDIETVDVVVDVVGGAEFGSLVDRLRDGGRLVVAGAVAGPLVHLDLRRLYLHQRRIIGSTMHTRSDFAQLADIAVAGGVDPLVAQTFPLARIAEAQQRFSSRDFVGKIVVQP